jgi:hypothetical protein
MAFLTTEYSPWYIGVSWDRTTTIPEIDADNEMEAAGISVEGHEGKEWTGSVNLRM